MVGINSAKCLSWLFGALLSVGLALAPAQAVGQDDSATKLITAVRESLKSDDPVARRKAIGMLVHSNVSAMMLAEMREALKDEDGDVRSVAATAIGNLGAAATPAVPQLIAQLNGDPVKEARETAARALGRIGKAAPDETRAVASLQVAGKEDADPVTRVVALGALAMMGIEVPKQIAAIRKFLQHADPLPRMKAAHALGGLGLPAKAAAPEIVRVLEQESDAHRRGYVARALGNVGDPASLPAILAALAKESDAEAKGEMRGAIRRLGGKVPE